MAHIGALKVIEEAGIPIDYIAGTSMGAIVGALYAIGYTPQQLDSMVRSQDWSFLLSDEPRRNTKTFVEKEDDSKYVLTLPFNKAPKEVIPDGIIKGQNLESLFTKLTIGYHDSLNYNKLPIPFACVAVDLAEGQEVVFHSGRLATTMRASMAIPAAFTPVRMGNMVLVDGGLINNFPVDVAQRMGADIIIGVDVQSNPKDEDNLATVTDMIDKMSGMLSNAKFEENAKHVDLYIKVDVKGYNAASFNTHALDTLTHRGLCAAQNKWSDMLELKKKIGVKNDFRPAEHGPYRPLSEDNPVFIRKITFADADEDETARLMKSCKLKEYSQLTMTTLRQAMDQLYALQVYSDISYTLREKPEGGYDLEFNMKDNRVNMFRLGLRFDWEEVASVLLNGTYHFDTHIPTSGSVTARFGKRAGVRLDYNILPNPLRHFNLSYAYQYNDINIYKRGKRQYNATYHYHFAEAGYSHIFNRDLKLGVGLRYEHFKYRDFLFNRSDNPINVSPEGFFSYYALARYETMDKKVYPNSGTSLQADVSVYTDNLSSYNGNAPFATFSLWWKSVFSTSSRFAILPAVYGRIITGRETPYPYLNAVGGDIPARYVPQQVPFEGITFMESMDNALLVGSVRFRHRLSGKHYLFLTTNVGLTGHRVKDMPHNRKLAGAGLTYGYSSLFGPLEASFNYSNRTKSVEFYLNIGYKF